MAVCNCVSCTAVASAFWRISLHRLKDNATNDLHGKISKATFAIVMRMTGHIHAQDHNSRNHLHSVFKCTLVVHSPFKCICKTPIHIWACATYIKHLDHWQFRALLSTHIAFCLCICLIAYNMSRDIFLCSVILYAWRNNAPKPEQYPFHLFSYHRSSKKTRYFCKPVQVIKFERPASWCMRL